jgi:CheY-like chemotaxis protein
MNKKKILIVDDEVKFTRLLKLTVEQTGAYTVQVENRPEEAVGAAERFLPDLALMDVMMPGIDGGTLAARYRTSETLKQVPIVFLTAAVKRAELQEHNGKIGGYPFLAKPVDVHEIIRCLQEHLGT